VQLQLRPYIGQYVGLAGMALEGYSMALEGYSFVSNTLIPEQEHAGTGICWIKLILQSSRVITPCGSAVLKHAS